MIEMHYPRHFSPIKTGPLNTGKKPSLPTTQQIERDNKDLTAAHMRDGGLLQRLRKAGTFLYEQAAGGVYWIGFTKTEKKRFGLK